MRSPGDQFGLMPIPVDRLEAGLALSGTGAGRGRPLE
jgi:hypothetical protein